MKTYAMLVAIAVSTAGCAVYSSTPADYHYESYRIESYPVYSTERYRPAPPIYYTPPPVIYHPPQPRPPMIAPPIRPHQPLPPRYQPKPDHRPPMQPPYRPEARPPRVDGPPMRPPYRPEARPPRVDGPQMRPVMPLRSEARPSASGEGRLNPARETQQSTSRPMPRPHEGMAPSSPRVEGVRTVRP